MQKSGWKVAQKVKRAIAPPVSMRDTSLARTVSQKVSFFVFPPIFAVPDLPKEDRVALERYSFVSCARQPGGMGTIARALGACR